MPKEEGRLQRIFGSLEKTDVSGRTSNLHVPMTATERLLGWLAACGRPRIDPRLSHLSSVYSLGIMHTHMGTSDQSVFVFREILAFVLD